MPDIAVPSLPDSILGNGQTSGSTRTELGVSLNAGYDSRIDTQSNPKITNGEPLRVHNYKSPDIQNRCDAPVPQL